MKVGVQTALVGQALAAVLLLVSAPQSQATVVPAEWWSNRTDLLQVVQIPNRERVRLGDFTSGFIEGFVALPESGDWRIDLKAHSDETNEHLDEFIEVFIDGVSVTKFFNDRPDDPPPASARFQYSHSITGDSFTYRFEFSSPVADIGQHMVMDEGSVTLRQVPEPASVTLLGLGLAGLGYSRRKHFTRA